MPAMTSVVIMDAVCIILFYLTVLIHQFILDVPSLLEVVSVYRGCASARTCDTSFH